RKYLAGVGTDLDGKGSFEAPKPDYSGRIPDNLAGKPADDHPTRQSGTVAEVMDEVTNYYCFMVAKQPH
ncbi:hypothetical protein AtubIFM57143_001251, partial [Aspergillus tubingensis]